MTPDQMTALKTRIERLNKEIQLLERHMPVNIQKLLGDELHLHALERSLEVSLEAVLDIGRLVIAIKNLQKPKTNTEIFDILAQNKILPEDFATKICGIGGMRNVLVHDYIDIDYEKIFKALHNIDDIKQFVRYVALATDSEK